MSNLFFIMADSKWRPEKWYFDLTEIWHLVVHGTIQYGHAGEFLIPHVSIQVNFLHFDLIIYAQGSRKIKMMYGACTQMASTSTRNNIRNVKSAHNQEDPMCPGKVYAHCAGCQTIVDPHPG